MYEVAEKIQNQADVAAQKKAEEYFPGVKPKLKDIQRKNTGLIPGADELHFSYQVGVKKISVVIPVAREL